MFDAAFLDKDFMFAKTGVQRLYPSKVTAMLRKGNARGEKENAEGEGKVGREERLSDLSGTIFLCQNPVWKGGAKERDKLDK